MTDYQKYINALRKCATEHENDRTFTGHIIVSDLCRDTANLLETIEKKPITKNNLVVDCISREDALMCLTGKFEIRKYEPSELISIFSKRIKALTSVTPQEPQSFKWCTDCKEYDQEKHCCHRWSKVIRDTVEEMKQEPILDRLKVDIENEIRFWQEPSKYGDVDKRVREAKVSSYKHMLELIESIKALEQEPTSKSETLISLEVYRQVAWERDIAIQQLHELGYEFGQKIESTTKNDLGVDAISRAEVLKIFDEWFDTCNIADKKESPKAKIKALPSVTQEPRWIPVSVRLPEDSGEYLVFVEYENGEKFIDLGDIDCEGILKKWNYLPDYRVLAWQPLPKPYKMSGGKTDEADN